MTDILSEEDLDKVASKIADKLMKESKRIGSTGSDIIAYDCTKDQQFTCSGVYVCHHPHSCQDSTKFTTVA